MSRLTFLAVLAVVTATAACGDRSDSSPTAPPDAGVTGGPANLKVGAERAGRAAEERLARRMAMALADPGFRAYVKGALDRSTVREHKLHFRRLLRDQGARAMQALVRAGHETSVVVDSDVTAAGALEFYMPVRAHRAAWRGDDRVLVATARADHEAPVAFDVQGRRRLLSPDTPPSTPVLALVPIETDFGFDPLNSLPTPPPPPPPPSPPTGLYMTAAHFRDDFEGL